MGELQHGVYDDDECKGLTGEEINAFYDFDNDGESQVLDKTDQDSDSDEYDDSDDHLEESEVDEELELERNGPGSEDDHDVINYSAFHYTINH